MRDTPRVEKAGFVALLDISGEKVRQFGSVGYHLGNGIGVLIERAGRQSFVWKNESVEATPELLATYAEREERTGGAVERRA